MARVKRGTIANKRRKKVLKQAKGFKWGRKSKYKLAKQALMKAWSYSTRDRKVKKREKRRLWQTQLSAFLKEKGLSYSKFIAGLKKKDIQIDRKILSILVKEKPEAVDKIIEMVK
ncbi:MAG: 50S ribosomal protein L20 [Candidatus Pacebacteria bacterium]|jgi:large subunit ribosomal protein L20|nr:50S ribosomal protein L20 [Candidatus Paceibacterota bacterium]MDD5012810.1 50S ribosomal protein L20 [Candidatus Paceibacterota bacterium]MDD5752550.1 50S ribosomal protein L20 [Candidatus Paceibacterota bacterium]